MGKLKGVNLGNWLVLEKWMSPELYNGTTAEDETYLMLQLSEGEKRSRLKVHRDEWITVRDFAYIASLGLNTVRIPVPFFIFEDHGPYVSCVEYLDKAMEWAEEYGLKVLIDLHTVPGSQNGSDNAGICGISQWTTKQEYIDLTLDVLERLAIRYGEHSALWGIEVLNEPNCDDGPLAKLFDIGERYKAVDQEAAKKNKEYSSKWLMSFYTDAYKRIRKYLPVDKCVVFSDAFDTRTFADWLSKQPFENVMLDTHQYIMMADWLNLCEPHVDDYVAFIKEKFLADITYAQSRVRTFCGEWSLFNAQPGLEEESPEIRKDVYRRLADAQLEVWGQCEGFFYWTYRLNINDPQWVCWDLMQCVSRGWMPGRF